MKKVLVLDDDPGNLQVFAAILWSNGYNVLEASTPQEAFEAARRSHPIDLLVCDVGLKGERVSGTEVALTVAREHGNVPVLFVTGSPVISWVEGDQRNLGLLSSSAVEVLEKPFSKGHFEAAIARLESPSHTGLPVLRGG